MNYQEKFDRLKETTDPEAAKQFYFTELEPTFREIKTAAETILATNQDAMVRKSETVRRTAERMMVLTLTVALRRAFARTFPLDLTHETAPATTLYPESDDAPHW